MDSVVESCRYVFVYGPSGEAVVSSKTILSASGTRIATAKMPGILYDLGGEAGMGPPLNQDDWVSGDLYALRDVEGTLALLDVCWGCGPEDIPPFHFERCAQDAVLSDGRVMQCWVYLYQGAIEGVRRWGLGNGLAH